MGPDSGRASDWDTEIARLFDIPKRLFSTDVEAAAELLAILGRRGFPYVARQEDTGWIIQFLRKGGSEESIGGTGQTMQEAIAKAAMKLGYLLELEAEEGR